MSLSKTLSRAETTTLYNDILAYHLKKDRTTTNLGVLYDFIPKLKLAPGVCLAALQLDVSFISTLLALEGLTIKHVFDGDYISWKKRSGGGIPWTYNSFRDTGFSRTALHWVVDAGHVRMLEMLLKCDGVVWGIRGGVDILDFQDKLGNTALHLAAAKNDTEMFVLLLCAGADVGLRNGRGESALHLLAGTNNVRLVELLLNAGANITVRDVEGRNALDRAKLGGNIKMVEVLEYRTRLLPFMG